MKKTFKDSRGRGVIITVTNEQIVFHHEDDVMRQLLWHKSQKDNGYDVEEEKVDEFYCIDKQDWVSDKTQRLDREDNWHTHMKEKIWFTKKMYDFMNKHTS